MKRSTYIFVIICLILMIGLAFGSLFYRVYGDTEHEHTIVIDEAVAATCTETGLTEGSHCSECGEVLVEQYVTYALGHTSIASEEEVLVEATDDTVGEISCHCSVCGEYYIEYVIPDSWYRG